MTKIEWTDRVWNPITGCSPISLGCKHCYAERFAKRFKGRFGYPKDDPFRVTFHPDRLELPLHWRKPSRIFVNSMGDLFHGSVDSDRLLAVYAMMLKAHWHTYQVLTKRPTEAFYWYANHHHRRDLYTLARQIQLPDWAITREGPPSDVPLRNLWVGVTVESFHYVNRIDELRKIPAAVRFISFEPLIDDVGKLDLTGIDWVIVGGETGPGARLMTPTMVYRILDQCKKQDIPFFFKKWGSFYPKHDNRPPSIDGRIWRQFPNEK